jgi:putative transposase
MLKAFEYRIYPDKEQKEQIIKHIGSCRWIYNYALEKKIKAWEKDKKNLSRFDIQADLPKLKNAEDTKRLKEVNSQSLQASLEHLDRAYKTFFKTKKGFPKFKNKRKSKQSYSIPTERRKLTLGENRGTNLVRLTQEAPAFRRGSLQEKETI